MPGGKSKVTFDFPPFIISKERRMDRMRYTIGDVARSLGVTPAGLHYFEREGVIAPVAGSGNRRTYSVMEFIRLVSYRKYRNMEMPLREIARQFSASGDDYESIEQKLERQKQEAERAAARYLGMAKDIDWFREHIHMGIERQGQIDFMTMPHCQILMVGESGCISTDKEEQMEVAKWLEQMPSTRVSVIASPEGKATFGYSVRCDRAKEMKADFHAPVMGGATGVHTFVRVPKSFYDQPEMAFKPIWDYMSAHGFTQDGWAAGVILCVYCHEEELDTLVEVIVPFK